MRGSLHKAAMKPGSLPQGEFRWNIILSLGRYVDGTGKRKYRQKWVRFCGTRQQAEAKLTELLHEVDRGEFVEPSKITLADWLDNWLEKAVRPPRRSPNTYTSYMSAINRHLKPCLGQLTLQNIRPLHIERYYADLQQKLSPRSALMQHAILSSAMNAAVNAGIVRVSPTKRVSNRPRPSSTGDVLDNVWTAEEARRFLSCVRGKGDTQFNALFALALDAGLRKRELMGLQWRDLQGQTLRVERQCGAEGKPDEPVFPLPKGGRARTVDLSEETVALLLAHKGVQAEVKMRCRTHYRDLALIFAQDREDRGSSEHSTLGMPLAVGSIARHLDRFVDGAGVRRITVHGLRHTCATLLLSAGVPPHVVQRRLGHKGIEITLNLYAHVLPSHQADAASRLATLLHG